MASPLCSCTWGPGAPRPFPSIPKSPGTQPPPSSGPGVRALGPSPHLWRYHGNKAPCPPVPPSHRTQFLFESHLCLTSSCKRQE